jgi:serine protease Do
MYRPKLVGGLRQRFTVLVLITTLLLASQGHAEENDNIALLDRSAKAFASVVKKAGPAVVHVRVEKEVTGRGTYHGQNPFEFFNDPFFERFFGPNFQHPLPDQQQRRQPKRKQQGAGSGFIISEDGYILTNNHVVGEADTIKVSMDDEREFTAKVIGTDPQSDVALIKIDAKDLPTIPLGNSDTLEVGEWVIAIGSPFELNQTVTVGVVSAKGRNRIGINDYENFIQTDAAINPGNSGGPLLNIHGEVIGINTAIFSRSGGYMGIGFAIPINMAKQIQDQLQKKGKVTRGWLGVGIQDVDEDLAKSFQLDDAKGVLITEVTKDSPAKEAGVEQGDVLLTMDGRKLEGSGDLRNRIALTRPGSTVHFTIMRDGKQKDLEVTIGEQPEDFGRRASSGEGDASLSDMGLTLQNLTAELAQQFGYEAGQGILVSSVEPDSPAAEAGIKPGHLIEEVNRYRVRNLEELRQALKKSDSVKRILLRVRTGEYSQYIVLRAK